MADPARLRAEADELAEHARQRLRERGYTDDEIERAAQGLVDNNRLVPTQDGETVAGDWWWAEALGELRDAHKALQRDDTDAATRYLAEARERIALAQINRDGPDTQRGRLFTGHGSGSRALTRLIKSLLTDNPTWTNRRLLVALKSHGTLHGDWHTGTFTYKRQTVSAQYVKKQLISEVRNRLNLPARSR